MLSVCSLTIHVWSLCFFTGESKREKGIRGGCMNISCQRQLECSCSFAYLKSQHHTYITNTMLHTFSDPVRLIIVYSARFIFCCYDKVSCFGSLEYMHIGSCRMNLLHSVHCEPNGLKSWVHFNKEANLLFQRVFYFECFIL